MINSMGFTENEWTLEDKTKWENIRKWAKPLFKEIQNNNEPKGKLLIGPWKNSMPKLKTLNNFGDDNINALADRMIEDTKFINKLKEVQSKPQHQCYIGDTHGLVYGKNQLEYGMPVPCLITEKSVIKGDLGSIDGKHSDPFVWLDKKYKVTLNLLKNSRGLTLYTRSDLCAHEDYIDAMMGQEHLVVMIVTPYNDQVTRILEPGAPSYQRRVKAIEGLKEAGIDVKVISIDLGLKQDFKEVGRYRADYILNLTKKQKSMVEKNLGKGVFNE